MKEALGLVLFLLCCFVQLAWTSTRHDRVWPLSGTSTVDLGQSSPFGPRQKASENFRYVVAINILLVVCIDLHTVHVYIYMQV